MKRVRKAGCFAIVWLTVLTSFWTRSDASIAHNHVAALLVFPYVLADDAGGAQLETFLTISNVSSQPVNAHLSFINGNRLDSQYCYECSFNVSLVGQGSETLVLSRVAGVTRVVQLSVGLLRTCSARMGMVIVNVEDGLHNVLTDNVLMGEQVTVDYAAGTSVSLEAIPVQGNFGDGNRDFRFDGLEYEQLPAYVAGEFIAPDFAGPLEGELILFTLAFQQQFPPIADCAVAGIDAFGAAFTAGVQFGCWDRIPLRSIDPEFAYPYLGAAFGAQEHGWLKLRCTVFGTGQSTVATGGVLGVIVQKASFGAVLRRFPLGPAVSSSAAWGRSLQQSSFVGDSLVLSLAPPPP